MKISIKKQKTIETTVGYACDVCGKYFSYESIEEEMELQEMIHISDRGGYSSVIGDDIEWAIDICQHCFHKKFSEYIRIIEGQ